VSDWNEEVQGDERLRMAAVMQLGDLIDGQNSGKYGHGLEFDQGPKSEEAWRRALHVRAFVRACACGRPKWCCLVLVME
jgi:hypothetical protein